jgi:hypothetical protein
MITLTNPVSVEFFDLMDDTVYFYLYEERKTIEKKYLDDREKAILQKLIDECLPYEIELIPAEEDSCDALAFRFSVFNDDAEQQEEWTLIRIADTDDPQAYDRTGQILSERFSEQYGSLTDACQPNWLMGKMA